MTYKVKLNNLFTVDSINKNPAWCKEVLINGSKIELKLASGADVNIFPFHFLKESKAPYKALKSCYVQLQAYEGLKLTLLD